MAQVQLRASEVWILEFDNVINPVAASYIHKNIQKAQETNVEVVILKLDTPGGLMTSMRAIIKDIMNSEVPVAVYVSPRGAQCASAGVFITISAHIAAMSPGTNIGSAHPVNLGGGLFGEKPDSANTEAMMEKVTNDAVAFIRSLAKERGRNEIWVEEAVRQSVNITEVEAVEMHVVDFVARDVTELLEQMNGRTVTVPSGEKTLKIQTATVVEKPMGFHHRFLNVISEPNIAYILLILGFYGIFFEIRSPGTIFPGVLGGIFLILAFFSLQVLPINYAGLALILVGIILFILEIHVVSYGLLTIGGLTAMILGSMMLIDISQVPKELFSISLGVIIPLAILTALFFVFALGMAFRAHRKKPTTGSEGIVGEMGTVIKKLDPEGTVMVHGEYWNATADETIDIGKRVLVQSIDRMVLKVKVIS
jgi:membrane-bound serine protease (ClpP class)